MKKLLWRGLYYVLELKRFGNPESEVANNSPPFPQLRGNNCLVHVFCIRLGGSVPKLLDRRRWEQTYLFPLNKAECAIVQTDALNTPKCLGKPVPTKSLNYAKVSFEIKRWTRNPNKSTNHCTGKFCWSCKCSSKLRTPSCMSQVVRSRLR